MNFKNTYTDLEPNRNFYTIWARLPKEAEEVIHIYLSPIKDNLVWASTYSGELARRIPHITLRYLGYKDELDNENIKTDVSKFKDVLGELRQFEVEMGKIDMYTEYLGEKLSKSRISWEILNIDELKEIQGRLLKVEGYDSFSSLEGDNFHPHVSLGRLDVSNLENLEKVKRYVEENKIENKKYMIKDVEINLCGEVIPLFS